MAQAQVTITAVDRTQAAINSAVRGMKTIERTAKVTAKAVNLAFGFLTGSLVVGAFGKILDAAKKTDEGRKAVDRLNQSLNDPALQSAAQTLTTTLIKGFTAAVDLSASLARNVSNLAKSQVLSKPENLARIIAGAATGNAAIVAGQIVGEAEAAALAIESQLSGKGPSRRGRGTVLGLQRSQLAVEAVAAKNAAEAQKKLGEEAKKAQKALTEAEAARTEMYRQFYEELSKTPDLLETNFDATDVKIAESVESMLEEMNRADNVMQEFARQAASNIQSAFADFLFDPFENGLRGMLAGFLNVIRRMVAEVAASAILNSIFGGYRGKGGVMGAFADALTGKAMGGPVSANTPYIVGERGPELFVPGTSGGIVPNNKLGMSGGVTVAPVYNIDARGATADLQRALPGILQENNRRIFDELDRRYGIGR